MPLTRLLMPADDLGDRLPVEFEDAPEAMEIAGVMPAEAVLLLVEEHRRGHKGWKYVTPSQANPDKTCRRKTVFERWLAYEEEPDAAWARIEGNLWHGLYTQLPTLEGWHKEVWLPDQEGLDDEHEKVRVLHLEGECKTCKGDGTVTQYGEDNKWGCCPVCLGSKQRTIRQLELFPGWWTRMRVDRASPDWDILVDHKNQKYPKTYARGKPPKDWAVERDAVDDWPIQLGCYAEGIKILKGAYPDHTYVWRKYQGGHKPAKPFTRILVKPLVGERLWERIGKHVTSLQEYLDQAEARCAGKEGEELEAAVKEVAGGVPMDGYDQNLFSGWLCKNGCPFKEMCHGMADFLQF